ncbi:MAG: aminotransferase class V-fold PLP-dependent enzyme [Bacteroidetes bacterium]|nr:aminotransferase class V-fold PLP-dependent enzyme [Bacteroidota bacterium]
MTNSSALISTIKKLETESLPLEVPAQQRATLLKEVDRYTDTFLNTLPQQKAYNKEGYERTEADDAFEINGDQIQLDDLIQLLQERVDNTGLNPASGGHLGYIPAGGIYTSALADYIAAVTNRYSGVFYASPGAVRIENVLIRWIGKLIGYSENFGGNITSGGSLANLISIAAARTAFKLKGVDIKSSVIYICQQAHHSILKALKLTGLDECIIRVIDLDPFYRMDLQILRKQIERDRAEGLRPFILFANAGSTDVGAVDPLEEMGTIAKEYQLWFHVDAAYGGFFLMTEEGRKKMKGINQADSVILDPHKGLFLPYGSGMVMVKNVQHLFEANNFDANYMQDSVGENFEYSPAQLSPELSRHFRGLRMWLPLKLHGPKPFAACLDEKILLARYFYEKVKKIGFQTGPEPDLSIVIFWYELTEGNANEYNKNIITKIQHDGRVFISSTLIKEKFLMRFAALSFRTHLKQVDLLLSLLEESVQK